MLAPILATAVAYADIVLIPDPCADERCPTGEGRRGCPAVGPLLLAAAGTRRSRA